jgi:glucokinase
VNRDLPTTLVCAVDLGGTNLRAATVDAGGQIHDRGRIATPDPHDADKIVAAITSAVNQCHAAAGERGVTIDAVSIVVPGSVQAETGVIVNAPNLPAIVNFPLGAALTEKLQRPILLENDANAAALGEFWQGAGRGSQTIICLTLGTGVGSGIILDGKLWRGIDGTAGEIGHMSIAPFSEVRCNCGNVGCLEVYASATAIVRMAREALAEDSNSKLHSVAELTARVISQAADAGDALALQIFRQVGTCLGIAAANLVNIFNPEAIVFGGGVSAAFDLFAPQVHEEINRRAFPVPAQRCRVMKAERGDDAGLLGAARLVFGAR